MSQKQLTFTGKLNKNKGILKDIVDGQHLTFNQEEDK